MRGDAWRNGENNRQPALIGEGKLAALVAEIEMEEFERAARVLPMFLWLWENRGEVRRLLAQGISWNSLTIALGRLGLVDLAGGELRPEYCQAVWNRVTAFEDIMGRTGRTLVEAPSPEDEPRRDTLAQKVSEASSPAPGGATAVARDLATILARGRRAVLSDPPPIGPAHRTRRDPETERGEAP